MRHQFKVHLLKYGPITTSVPFDISTKHKERWQYLNRNRISKLDPVYLPSSKTPTTRSPTVRFAYMKNLIFSDQRQAANGIFLNLRFKFSQRLLTR